MLIGVALLVGMGPADADFTWSSKANAAKGALDMAKADAYASRAATLSRTNRRRSRVLAEEAVTHYERALSANPDLAEAHYRAAEVLYAHFISIRYAWLLNRYAQRAIGHWDRFSELRPLDPRATELLFRRALTHTLLATKTSFAHSLRDYEALLRRSAFESVAERQTAVTLNNAAEVHMMLDKLPSAINLYTQALRYSKETSYVMGLAVALDRDGQVDHARSLLKRMLSLGQLRAFKTEVAQGTTFYVPRGESYYYFALAHEALGKPAQAIQYYRQYIHSGAHPQFHARARSNIDALRKQTPSAPLPSR